MPRYPWLFSDKVEKEVVVDKLRVLKKLGTPYTDEQIASALQDYDAQANTVIANLASTGITHVVEHPDAPAAEQVRIDADPDAEITALIAYLMRLGRNLEPAGNPQSVNLGGGK